jgi:hypothetical protein
MSGFSLNVSADFSFPMLKFSSSSLEAQESSLAVVGVSPSLKFWLYDEDCSSVELSLVHCDSVGRQITD